LLVLGGTVFLGRHLVDAALARGHDVTTFTRGRHNPGLHPAAEALTGDREGDLSALRGRRWDAVVDTSSLGAEVVGRTAELLAPQVGHATYISSISAYRGWPAEPVDEESPLWEGSDPDDYAQQKAGSERAVAAAFRGRTLILRPGLIVGPYENIGRLPSWLRRIADGGEVLAAGEPGRRLQLIDARDLAAFAVACIERQATGAYNVTSPPGQVGMAELLDHCAAATGGRATFTWVDDAFALEQGVEPWTELPLWLPDTPGQQAVWSASAERARTDGLQVRAPAETVRDTWAWLCDRPDDSAPASPRLAPGAERAVLDAWHARLS
jgi:2'-hydroxyisoflavone reductase